MGNGYCLWQVVLFILSSQVWWDYFLCLAVFLGKGEDLKSDYSCLITTGKTNCVFTGIPLLIAGFILGKSTSLA